jgi:anthranilate phosphoribosyltransferase
MAKVMPTRKALATRTVFNILGPLTNPARPSFQLVGVAVPELADIVAGALTELGVERAIVVHGAGGADELTCAGDCIAIFVEDGTADRRVLHARDAGLEESSLDALRGGTPDQNAQTLRETLEGKPGPLADCVVFNAGAAFIAAGRASDVREGAGQAREVIERGDALAALERLIRVSNGE